MHRTTDLVINSDVAISLVATTTGHNRGNVGTSLQTIAAGRSWLGG